MANWTTAFVEHAACGIKAFENHALYRFSAFWLRSSVVWSSVENLNFLRFKHCRVCFFVYLNIHKHSEKHLVYSFLKIVLDLIFYRRISG